MSTSPPPLPQHTDMHDPHRKKRVYVDTVRARDKDFVVVLSDGSVVPWSQLGQVLRDIRAG